MDKSREWAEADGRSSNANPSWLVWRESRKVQLKIRSSNDEIWRKAEQFERVRRIDEKIFFSLSLNQESMFSFQEERFEYFKSFEFSNHSLETSIKRFRGDLSILVAKTYLERKIHLGVKLC